MATDRVERDRRYRDNNREKRRLQQRVYNKTAKRKRLQKYSAIKLKYGLTEEEFDIALDAQDHRCGICQQKTKLHVDHDHATGEPRGLLCVRCNTALGSFGDNPRMLLRAIKYLKGEL